jgi:apolipoprotein N-acyltransferase
LNWALALLSAALLILSNPGPDMTFAAPVALAPLLVAVARERRVGLRFFLGWSAGIVYWFGVCHWIQFVLEVHGGMGRWGGWGTFILFCLLKGLHFAAFGILGGFLIRRAYAVPAIAALWTGIERTNGPLGFAWLTLGNAGADMDLPVRLAPWAGVYGISFVFALMSAALAVILLRRPKHSLPYLAILPALFLLPDVPTPRSGSDVAAVVQTNAPEEGELTAASAHAIQQRYEYESLAAASNPERASLIVWPETPGPVYFYNDPVFHGDAIRLAQTSQAYFLFGTVAYTAGDLPLNSAVLLSPAGQVIDRYDKMFLVPFGEFIPPLFGWVNRITKEAGDFTAGSRVVVFRLGEHRLGAFICYESAFPHLVRQFAREGAEVFANLSNDGYFGHSFAREQHLKLVRMRAIENRRWIIRATNDGITAMIDPAGRVTRRLPMYVETAARMRFSYESGTTFYTRHGDWFAWSCLIAGVGLAVFEIARALVSRGESPAHRHP